MRALLSVSDREGILELARGLADAEIELFATDGTRAHLTEGGLEVRPVSDLTETSEILGGRVKTLHPSIFAPLLARRDKPDHMTELADQGLEAIDIVVVNLYPFAQAIREPATTLDQALEQIDIGGVSLLRAAAKNFPGVAAVSSPTQYASVLRDIKTRGSVSPETRQKLAGDAFALTAAYDAQIASYLNAQSGSVFPTRLAMVVEKKADLRYGENPHQLGAFYTDPGHAGGSISAAHQIAGKDLSFNNLLDLDAAWTIASDFKTPAVCIVKHGNPAAWPAWSTWRRRSAWRSRATASRPTAASSAPTGPSTRPPPGPSAPASSRPSWRRATPPRRSRCCARSVASRSWRCRRPTTTRTSSASDDSTSSASAAGCWSRRSTTLEEDRDKLQTVTQRRPTLEELTDLLFAWRAVRHVKSNAVVLAKKHAMIGMGAGQPSRVVSVEVALRKAGERAPLSVMASDAYFPFPDGIQIAAQAGRDRDHPARRQHP